MGKNLISFIVLFSLSASVYAVDDDAKRLANAINLCMRTTGADTALDNDKRKELGIPEKGSEELKAMGLKGLAVALSPLLTERISEQEKFIRTYFPLIVKPDVSNFSRAATDEKFRAELEQSLATHYAGSMPLVMQKNTINMKTLRAVLRLCENLGDPAIKLTSEMAGASLDRAISLNTDENAQKISKIIKEELAAGLKEMKAERYKKPELVEAFVQGFIAVKVKELRDGAPLVPDDGVRRSLASEPEVLIERRKGPRAEVEAAPKKNHN